jgi:hypothetical protein
MQDTHTHTHTHIATAGQLHSSRTNKKPPDRQMQTDRQTWHRQASSTALGLPKLCLVTQMFDAGVATRATRLARARLSIPPAWSGGTAARYPIQHTAVTPSAPCTRDCEHNTSKSHVLRMSASLTAWGTQVPRGSACVSVQMRRVITRPLMQVSTRPFDMCQHKAAGHRPTQDSRHDSMEQTKICGSSLTRVSTWPLTHVARNRPKLLRPTGYSWSCLALHNRALGPCLVLFAMHNRTFGPYLVLFGMHNKTFGPLFGSHLQDPRPSFH